MDFNEEEEVLISLRDLENSDEEFQENGFHENGGLFHENGGTVENGHMINKKHSSYNKILLPWLDSKVFYIRLSKCVINDDFTPDHLTLNHVPLNRDTLLEVNGVRTSIYSDGVSSLLKRDRLDKKSEEITFVCTDSIRISGSVKFEVFNKETLILFGELKCQGQNWNMNCESDVLAQTTFFKVNSKHLEKSISPSIEVYVAGCFLGSPIVLTKFLHLSHRRKHVRKGMLESIPEYEATRSPRDDSSGLAIQSRHFTDFKPHDEFSLRTYSVSEYFEGEDGELSWFNAGVRVGVGIGLSVCLGVGIGVGLLAKTYHGTKRNFTRRLL